MPENQSLLIIACACGQKMKVPAAAEGKIYKCVRCGEHMQVRAEAAHAAKPGSREVIHEPVGELLISQGLITQGQLDTALEQQQRSGGKTFEILIRQGILDKEALHAFLSRQPGIATIDLARLSVDRAILELIPKQLALDQLVLPIDRLGKLLTVAMACPLDSATIAEVESITGLRVKAMLCRLDDIHNAVKKYYRVQGDSEDTTELYRKLLATAPAPARADVGQELQSIEMLPMAPASLEAALTLSGKDSIRDWIQVVLRDPAFAATTLRIANLPAYALPGRTTSIPMAAALIGAAGLECIIRESDEAKRSEIPLLEQLTLRGRRLAALCSALAMASRRVSVAQAQTAGLLAELGRYVHLLQAPERAAKIPPNIFGAVLAETELKQFSLDHAQAGALLAKAWRLPESLVAALQFQLKPMETKAHRSLAGLLHLAAALAGTTPEGAEIILESQSAALRELNLDLSQALQAAERHLKTSVAA